MSIEIRQLLIKSNVAQRRDAADAGGCADSTEAQSTDVMREDILAECRRLILEVLSERGER